MRANIVQLLLVILAFCTFCYGMENYGGSSSSSSNDGKDQADHLPQFGETSSGYSKRIRNWLNGLIKKGEHLKPDSGPSTAPIMPAQNSAMLYNSTGRTSMPMSQHHPTASSYQSSGTNFFMADTNNSRSFVQQQNSTGSQPFPTAHRQSSAALTLPGGTSTALQPGQSTWVRKGKSKATSSASFKQPKSGRSSGTNFLAGSQPFPTAHGQSTTALALPGDAGGTSTALQPGQSSSNASDPFTMVKGWWT